jgi:ABC-type ATPase involved in cell division
MELFEECNVSGATLIIATHDEHIYQGANHRVLELQNGRFLPQEERTISTLNNMP